jgi:hypothetical protein
MESKINEKKKICDFLKKTNLKNIKSKKQMVRKMIDKKLNADQSLII